jgi:signal transduction histidine kinase
MTRLDVARERARRDAALWAAWALLVAVTVAATFWTLRVLLDSPDRLVPWAYLGLAGAPIAASALFSPRIRRSAVTVFRPTLVLCGLLLMVLAVYLVVVVGLGDGVDGSEHGVLGLSIVAGLVSVVLALPVRARLRALARDWSGPRRRPARSVLETFGTRMTRAVPMDELLLQLTETLRSTIGPLGAEVWTGADGLLERTVSVPEQPRDRITLAGPELAAVTSARVSGNAWAEVWLPRFVSPDRAIRIAPVTHLGKLLGLLVLARPSDAPGFSEDDDRVLAELARQVGLALHNVSLDTALQASLEELKERNVELQASRARIVAAADASRRQIERDLHDGAQQRLVAMAVKIGLLSRMSDDDPAAVQPMLDDLRSEVQATIDELRELAHGIYPPLLRNHGLGEALRSAAKRAGLPTVVTMETTRRFDPGVEAAVYFCCLEAMQNATKYAGDAASIEVRVDADDERLTFEVADDGVGFDATSGDKGHGFVNMRDRVGAFGGTVVIDSAAGRGTRITGTIPVAAGS